MKYVLLEKSRELKSNEMKGEEVIFVLSYVASMMDFKTYFAVEKLLNDHHGMGCSAPIQKTAG